MRNLMQALDIHGARSRNRTGTPLRAGDFKYYVIIWRAAALRLFSGAQFHLIHSHLGVSDVLHLPCVPRSIWRAR